MKCSTIGCRNQASRLMSWRDAYGGSSKRTTDPVCDGCLGDYQRRPALQVRDEGPVDPDAQARRLAVESVTNHGDTARRMIGERE